MCIRKTQYIDVNFIMNFLLNKAGVKVFKRCVSRGRGGRQKPVRTLAYLHYVNKMNEELKNKLPGYQMN